MFSLIIVILLICKVDSQVDKFTSDICTNKQCENNGPVCGIRKEGEGFRLRIFSDECGLKKFACAVEKHLVYDVTPFYYCRQVFKPEPLEERSCVVYDCSHPKDAVQVCAIKRHGDGFRVRLFENKCRLWEYNCEYKEVFNITDLYICKGLKLSTSSEIEDNAVEDGLSSLINFGNNEHKSSLVSSVTNSNMMPEGDLDTDQNTDQSTHQDSNKNNIYKENNSIIDDDELFIESDKEELENDTKCNPAESKNLTVQNAENVTPQVAKIIDEINETTTENIDDHTNISDPNIFKNVFVIRGSLKDLSRVNETISRFFAATHVYDLPVKEMPNDLISEDTRRRLVKIAGPIKVYKPWIVIPKNISDDFDHRPTLNSCYHKCPRKCPATYAPVCGVPGRLAREPSLMFQNHCFMDVAQCKMYWENKSPTSLSSAYQESSFVFCLGDVMNHMYNFLPLVKTLQHMGRLPKKGRFRTKLSNLKFFNNMLAARDPRLMG